MLALRSRQRTPSLHVKPGGEKTSMGWSATHGGALLSMLGGQALEVLLHELRSWRDSKEPFAMKLTRTSVTASATLAAHNRNSKQTRGRGRGEGGRGGGGARARRAGLIAENVRGEQSQKGRI